MNDLQKKIEPIEALAYAQLNDLSYEKGAYKPKMFSGLKSAEGVVFLKPVWAMMPQVFLHNEEKMIFNLGFIVQVRVPEDGFAEYLFRKADGELLNWQNQGFIILEGEALDLASEILNEYIRNDEKHIKSGGGYTTATDKVERVGKIIYTNEVNPVCISWTQEEHEDGVSIKLT